MAKATVMVRKHEMARPEGLEPPTLGSEDLPDPPKTKND